MKLGIDISQTAYRGTGVARFTTGLAEAICEYDQTNEWHFFFSSLRGKAPSRLVELIRERGFKLHRQYLPPTLLSRLWNELHAFDIQNLTGQLDWFITSDWTEPPASCKKATVIHDLVYIRYPQTVASLIRETQEKRMVHVKKESAHIFADSKSTKRDISDFLEIDDGRISVNYPGVDKRSAAEPGTFKRQFILTVGKREPRKNLSRLIDAYIAANPKDTDLIIVGEKGWGETPKPDGSDRIHFMGFINDDELADLYASCLFFVYPSVWEGFGYPVIEAMAQGAPVATSKTSSLGEIAKNNAVLFDPENTLEIKDAILKLSSDATLRKKLSSAGREHAAGFTWKRYYESFIKELT